MCSLRSRFFFLFSFFGMCVCVCVCVCVLKKPWPELERLTFNFRGGSAVSGSWGGREGGQSESEALQCPPPSSQAGAKPVHPMLYGKKKSCRSDRCGDDSVSGSSFEVLMLPELWEPQSVFTVLPPPLTNHKEPGVFPPRWRRGSVTVKNH